jgi:D-aminoacyl-tRNA deacylase
MRLLIQRVAKASVRINHEVVSSIDSGLLVFIGAEEADNHADIQWLTQKLVQLRIFSDHEGKMNLNIAQVNGQFLIVSQFTLHGSTKKGNRPSFIRAARPESAKALYESFIMELQLISDRKVEVGVFGADMKVELVNDGPVTIWIDSRNRE